jgi:hypothetical protein
VPDCDGVIVRTHHRGQLSTIVEPPLLLHDKFGEPAPASDRIAHGAVAVVSGAVLIVVRLTGIGHARAVVAQLTPSIRVGVPLRRVRVVGQFPRRPDRGRRPCRATKD